MSGNLQHRKLLRSASEQFETTDVGHKLSGAARSKKTTQPFATILAIFGLTLLAAVLTSWIVTDSLTFGYPVPNWRKYVPRKEIALTEAELAQYDGSDPSKPIYLAIDGKIYDVSAGPSYYGKGGGYNFFAGKDAARAYITGCFDTHLTHDLRGLNEAQIKTLDTWTDFYGDHDQYFYVGRVIHDPIDPDSPIPPDCNQQ